MGNPKPEAISGNLKYEIERLKNNKLKIRPLRKQKQFIGRRELKKGIQEDSISINRSSSMKKE